MCVTLLIFAHFCFHPCGVRVVHMAICGLLETDCRLNSNNFTFWLRKDTVFIWDESCIKHFGKSLNRPFGCVDKNREGETYEDSTRHSRQLRRIRGRRMLGERFIRREWGRQAGCTRWRETVEECWRLFSCCYRYAFILSDLRSVSASLSLNLNILFSTLII